MIWYYITVHARQVSALPEPKTSTSYFLNYWLSFFVRQLLSNILILKKSTISSKLQLLLIDAEININEKN